MGSQFLIKNQILVAILCVCEGVWAHGDFCLVNPNTGGIWMLGRRWDLTLNQSFICIGSHCCRYYKNPSVLLLSLLISRLCAIHISCWRVGGQYGRWSRTCWCCPDCLGIWYNWPVLFITRSHACQLCSFLDKVKRDHDIIQAIQHIDIERAINKKLRVFEMVYLRKIEGVKKWDSLTGLGIWISRAGLDAHKT